VRNTTKRLVPFVVRSRPQTSSIAKLWLRRSRCLYIGRLLREDAAGLDKFGLIAVPLVAQKRHKPTQLRALTPPTSLMTMGEEKSSR
jgi:hypothetical protein